MTNKQTTYYFFFLFLSTGFTLSATPLDSLLSLLDQSNEISNPTFVQQTHYQLGLHYYNQQESFEKAKDHLEKALAISKKYKVDDNLINIYSELGKCYNRTTNYSKALESYFNIVEMEDIKCPISDKASAFGNIASIYQALGNYDKAYQFQMKGLAIHEKEKDNKGIGKDLYVLGTIFYYQKRYEQSLEYYLRSKEICDLLKINKRTYACLGALGSVYSKLGDNEKSASLSYEALELAKKMNYKTGIAYSQGNIASDLTIKKEYSQAEALHLKSIQLKKELGDTWGVIGGLTNLSDLYIEWEKPTKAIPSLHEALELSRKIDSSPRVVNTYKYLNKVYHSIGQTDSAYLYLEKYVALQDSLMNEKTLEEMGKTKNLYEFEKKEQEIKLLKTKSENQQLQKYIFIIVGFFLMLACWGFFSRLKYQRATNALLEDKNEEIQIQNIELQHTQDQLLQTNILLEENNLLLEEKNLEIEEKNNLLEESNDDLKNFAYVASHDLKEPLRMISSYTTLIKKRYHDTLDETGQEFMHYIVDGAHRMKVMLDDLLSYSRVGTQEDTKTWVDMSDIMVIVNANLTPRLREQGAKLVVKEKNLPAIKANNTQMIQLLQNLVSNGIKFRGERDPVVTVDCRYDNNKYIFSVADNGIGITEENKKKVFEMFKRLHTRDEYEGTGIGLATCKKIVTKHGGELWVESTFGEGSTFLFSIPCPIDQPNNQSSQTKSTKPTVKKTPTSQPSNDQLINSQADR